jgi:steroid 5-alpha reductase family enzyme
MQVAVALLLGWVVMSIAMACLWWYQSRRGDAGIVDVAWGLGVGLLGTLFCWLSEQGDFRRRLLLAALVLIWSLRLSAHIAARLRRMPEDGRYQNLRVEWGARAQSKLFGFFQLQAFWSILFALPILCAARNPNPFPGPADVVAIALWLVAVAGESISDWQLQRFRMDPANRGQVCRQGLWYYTRHPNYFFEWLHWWVYPLLAVGAPGGAFALAGPLVMYWFLTRVTGIPPTEAQALRTRGEAYREYQATTNSFFPWFPREGRGI